MHGPLPLKQASRHKVAGKMISWIPGTVNGLIDQLGDSVDYSFEEDSVLNRLYSCRSRLSMCRVEDLRAIIRDELLPLMIEMGATDIYGVTVDAQYQGQIYTFAKFGQLMREYTSEEVCRLVFDQGALSGILPSALNVLWYVNTLTRLSPLALTLALSRGDCAWHFVGPGAFVFTPSEGLFHQFMEPISPVSARSFFLPTRLMPSLTKEGSDVFLRVVVDAVNSIAGFMNDLRSFADSVTKIVDFSKQIQTSAALDLLFADIASLNHSTAGFHRITVQ